MELVPDVPEAVRCSYSRLSLRDVQLSFAGFRSPGHHVHKAIASLSPGDHLKVMTDRSPWELTNSVGIAVGRLAQSFRVPLNGKDVSATVLAIARWSKSKSEPEFLDRLKMDEWEVVIPEIVVGGNS